MMRRAIGIRLKIVTFRAAASCKDLSELLHLSRPFYQMYCPSLQVLLATPTAYRLRPQKP